MDVWDWMGRPNSWTDSYNLAAVSMRPEKYPGFECSTPNHHGLRSQIRTPCIFRQFWERIRGSRISALCAPRRNSIPSYHRENKSCTSKTSYHSTSRVVWSCVGRSTATLCAWSPQVCPLHRSDARLDGFDYHSRVDKIVTT